MACAKARLFQMLCQACERYPEGVHQVEAGQQHACRQVIMRFLGGQNLHNMYNKDNNTDNSAAGLRAAF